MAEEIAFENGQISNFEGLVTLTLDRAILILILCHSSTSTYMPNFIEIEETFCGWTDGRTYAHMYAHTYACTYGWTDGHLRLALLGQLCQRVDLKRRLKSRLIFWNDHHQTVDLHIIIGRSKVHQCPYFRNKYSGITSCRYALSYLFLQRSDCIIQHVMLLPSLCSGIVEITCCAAKQLN